MKKQNVWLVLLFLISGFFYYFYSNSFVSTGNSVREINVAVERVIDGDTIVLEDGEKVRFLGINTPEKGEFYKNESTEFTKQIENKSVRIEIFDKDKYGRNLGYVFYNGKMLNEELLRNGFASIFIYNEDKYTNKLKKAEGFARDNNLGIWKKSENFGCLTIKEFKYLEDGQRCTNKEKIVLQNFCGVLNVTIKDDATHIEHELISKGFFEKNYSCIWNDAGDTLFIWDKTGLLVFERY